MKKPISEHDPAILIREEELCDGTKHLIFVLCEVGLRTDVPSAESLYPRTPEYVAGLYTAHGELGVHAFQRTLGTPGRFLESIDAEYLSAPFINEIAARDMLKSIRKLQRALNRQAKKLGRVDRVSVALVCFARAVGAKCVFYRAAREGSSCRWICDTVASAEKHVQWLDESAERQGAAQSDPIDDATGQGRR